MFMLVDTRIEDPEAYEEYKALARPIVEKYGGIYRARGGELKVLEDDLWTPSRLVVIEFPDMASMETFYNSDEYTPLRAIRRANAKCSIAVVEGL
ncbi:MAG: DUF1330 domain-containing protein [Rhizobiaceae bacterium]